jgi:hypothetical protein
MITKFSDRLYADLNKDLNALVLEEDQLIKRLEKSIHVCLKYLRKLKDYCKLNDPGTPAEEIVFFMYIMEMLTTLFRAKLTTGLADFWVAANAIKACTKIVI